jgi:class 3 adenylate cyclase
VTSTSPELQALLCHYAGREQLHHAFYRPGWWPPGVMFAASPERRLFWSLSESFGKQEFDAGICFIDMVGFAEKARGKTPKEVSAIVSPFLRTVITAATEHKCFVDKTIGDEVMVVMPVFPHMDYPLSDMAWFLFGVVRRLEAMVPDVQFRAGIAFGKVFLDEIQAESYQEWSVFGNCVNGAKRLQTIATPAEVQALSAYRAVIGAVDSDYPNFLHDFETWLQRDQTHDFRYRPPLEFLEARKDCEELKGVGRMCFQDSFLRVKASAGDEPGGGFR